MAFKKHRRRHSAADASPPAADLPSEPPKAKAKPHHHESAAMALSTELREATASSAATPQTECYADSLATALAIVHPKSLAAFAQGEAEQRGLHPEYAGADNNPQPEADQVLPVRCNECWSEFLDVECMCIDWIPPSKQSGPLLWRCQLCREIFYSLRRLSARRPPIKVLCFTLDSSAHFFSCRADFHRTLEFQ